MLYHDRYTTRPTGEWIYTDEIVKKYCVGRGVEVGPADHPVQGVNTVLVDNKADFAGKQYTVDYIMEADNLHLFQNGQFDFLIAIHMLEHFPNPIKALKEWYRVVRDGGVLFIVVPQKGCTFDKYRNTTPLSHLIEDYEKNTDNSDLTHIDEWCNYAIPVIEAEQGNPGLERVEAFRSTLKQQVKDGVNIDIHFHTWERIEDMMQLMGYLGWEVVQIADRYTIGKPVGAGNGILTVVRVRKTLSSPAKTRVLLLSDSVVSGRMAGAGARLYEMANRLSEVCEVTLMVPGESDLKPEKFKLVSYPGNPGNVHKSILNRYLDASDVLILGGQTLAEGFPSAEWMEKIFVIDLSTPPVLENLEHRRRELGNQGVAAQIHQEMLSRIHHQLQIGDYFICANEAQRNFWLGMLCSQNRINPYTYDGDPSVRNLIDVVPYGIPEERPVHSRQVLKGVYPGIQSTDKVLLWGGSLVEWLDTVTLLKAMVLIAQQRRDIKLFFMGIEHPEGMQKKILADTMDMAKIFSLYDNFVFFNDWVPYEERQNYLLEADIGVVTHAAGLETQFSSRNRVMDYIWAGLPILITQGDSFSDLVHQHRLGLGVKPGDVEGLATAILKMAEDAAFKQQCVQNMRAISHQFTWKNTLKPLIQFCKNPRKRPDRSYMAHRPSLPLGSQRAPVDRPSDRRQGIADKIHRTMGFFANLKTSLRRKRLKLSEYPSCGIGGRNRVSQTFRAECPNLYRIDIKFAMYYKWSSRNLTFRLRKAGISDMSSPDGAEIACISLNASQIRDNEFYPFVFPRQSDSQGQVYYFCLESPDSAKGNPVSVWCTENPSPVQFGCQPITCYERGWKSRAQVLFRAYYV